MKSLKEYMIHANFPEHAQRFYCFFYNLFTQHLEISKFRNGILSRSAKIDQFEYPLLFNLSNVYEVYLSKFCTITLGLEKSLHLHIYSQSVKAIPCKELGVCEWLAKKGLSHGKMSSC